MHPKNKLTDSSRLSSATYASAIHLSVSVAIAALLASFIFLVWYPKPYADLSGGKELFLLVLGVDIICGPLLTGFVFNSKKSKKELMLDIGLVVLIQISALGYGVYSVWHARPLFLVMEVDRFKVIAAPDLEGVDAQRALSALPKEITPKFLRGPLVVGIRSPKDVEERKSVLLESIQGGRDYAQRPEFYIPYGAATAEKTFLRAKPIALYVAKYSDKTAVVDAIAMREKLNTQQLKFLPVVGRQDWIAVLNPNGYITDFLPGDGF